MLRTTFDLVDRLIESYVPTGEKRIGKEFIIPHR